MKILVFSDTHGVTDMMEEAVATHQTHGGIDMLIHLGDGCRDFDIVASRRPGIPRISVAGNHEEFLSSYLDRGNLIYEQKFTLDGITFLAVHGHKLYVKSGIQYAADYAVQSGANVLLYGHTHDRTDVTARGSTGDVVRLINPGTGRGYNASYAVLHIVNGQLSCGFAERNR